MLDQIKTDPMELEFDGKKLLFDIDNPVLPTASTIARCNRAVFPYDKKLDGDDYENDSSRSRPNL